MPKFSNIFLPFLVNQSQKHKHKLISSKNKNTNTNPATNLPCQSNTKATNTNSIRSKQLKTVSSKCSSLALPLVLFFPFQIIEINYFFLFHIRVSDSLSLSLTGLYSPCLTLSALFLSLSLTAWTSMDKLKLCYSFLRPPFTFSRVHRCASLVLSLSPPFFFFHCKASKAKTTILVHRRWPPPLQMASILGFSTIDFEFESETEVCHGFVLWGVCCEISLYFWVGDRWVRWCKWVWSMIGWFGGVSGFRQWGWWCEWVWWLRG